MTDSDSGFFRISYLPKINEQIYSHLHPEQRTPLRSCLWMSPVSQGLGFQNSLDHSLSNSRFVSQTSIHRFVTDFPNARRK
jgi:hypothetical protein